MKSCSTNKPSPVLNLKLQRLIKKIVSNRCIESRVLKRSEMSTSNSNQSISPTRFRGFDFSNLQWKKDIKKLLRIYWSIIFLAHGNDKPAISGNNLFSSEKWTWRAKDRKALFSLQASLNQQFSSYVRSSQPFSILLLNGGSQNTFYCVKGKNQKGRKICFWHLNYIFKILKK